MTGLVAATGGHPTIIHPYPPALAKYEDVVANPKLFMDTLQKLHAMMKTKFMTPIIGGRELDLHRLFVEVTSRGGIERILSEKKWKEVTAVFNFPSTATNASFVLRKYYYQLLNHYEQIYFLKASGWSPLPPGATHAVPIAVVQPSVMRPPPDTAAASAPGAPPVGSPVIGVIDGKFESGYLVTVTIGSEKLKGVLYQAPTPAPPPYSSLSQTNPDFVTGKRPRPAEGPPPMSAPPVVKRRRRRRKKSEIKKRDPAHPKPNRSGYNFFFKDQHARLKPLYHGKDREISRMIGELWNKLKENDRAVYQEKAAIDKERYRKEMEGYREKKRIEREQEEVVSEAVPIQQRVPQVLGAGMVDVGVQDNKGAPVSGSPFEIEDDDDDGIDQDDEDEVSSGSISSGGAAETAADKVGDSEHQHVEKKAEVEIMAAADSAIVPTAVGVEKLTEQVAEMLAAGVLPTVVDSTKGEDGGGKESEQRRGNAGKYCCLRTKECAR